MSRKRGANAGMKLVFQQAFSSRQEISNILGGDIRKGIARSASQPVILLFTNEDELYSDYFYPKGKYDYCMFTGIGRVGHQDSTETNQYYYLNIAVLAHKLDGRHLLVFEKQKGRYRFVGEYSLLETHQNVQPDRNNDLRRLFVFHLKRIADSYAW